MMLTSGRSPGGSLPRKCPRQRCPRPWIWPARSSMTRPSSSCVRGISGGSAAAAGRTAARVRARTPRVSLMPIGLPPGSVMTGRSSARPNWTVARSPVFGHGPAGDPCIGLEALTAGGGPAQTLAHAGEGPVGHASGHRGGHGVGGGGCHLRAAIRNAGFEFPADRITVNLAPAGLRKEGAAFDLPMALGILCATGLVKPERLEHALVLGELSLDGRVRPVRGVLPVALHCRRRKYAPLVVHDDNAAEAYVVEAVAVIPVRTIHDTVEYLNGERAVEPARADAARWLTGRAADGVDFADVRGQA